MNSCFFWWLFFLLLLLIISIIHFFALFTSTDENKYVMRLTYQFNGNRFLKEKFVFANGLRRGLRVDAGISRKYRGRIMKWYRNKNKLWGVEWYWIERSCWFFRMEWDGNGLSYLSNVDHLHRSDRTRLHQTWVAWAKFVADISFCAWKGNTLFFCREILCI